MVFFGPQHQVYYLKKIVILRLFVRKIKMLKDLFVADTCALWVCTLWVGPLSLTVRCEQGSLLKTVI